MLSAWLFAFVVCLPLLSCTNQLPGQDDTNFDTRTASDTLSSTTDTTGIHTTVDDEWKGTITVNY